MPGDYALRLSGGLTPLLEAPAAMNEQPPQAGSNLERATAVSGGLL